MQKNNSLDFDKVTQAFVRALRGKKSQDQLSKQLNFSFNVVSRWENNARVFYWNDFLELAKIDHLDVHNALRSTTGYSFKTYPKATELLKVLLDLPSNSSAVLNILSYRRLRRLESGQTKCSFKDILQILEVIYGRTDRFLNFFVDVEKDINLKNLLNSKDSYLNLLQRDPLSLFIRLVLTFDNYKELPMHDDQFIADLLGVSVSDVRVRIGLLEETEIIKKQGAHFVTSVEHVDTGSRSRLISQKISQYLHEEIVRFIQMNPSKTAKLRSAYLVFPTNQELEKKVFDLSNRYYMDLKNLVSQSANEKKESIRVVTIDLYNPLTNYEIFSDIIP